MPVDFRIASQQLNQVIFNPNEIIEISFAPRLELQDHLEHGSALGQFSLANGRDNPRAGRARAVRKQGA